MTRLIRQINFPADLRKFKKNDLKQISKELRDELIDIVSETGGFDIAMDDNYLYTSIQGDNPSVYRINKNDKNDIILISGGNGKGSEENQYENPVFIDIDYSGNIFVSDDTNLRIMKISKN